MGRLVVGPMQLVLEPRCGSTKGDISRSPLLPNEIQLAIFAEFPITTLLAARGVCRRWRDLTLLADIKPIRRSLIDIYLQVVAEPWFLESRPWVVNNLVPFDRQAYVHALLEQHDYLPEDFQIWVTEWPAKAAFAGVWPGLPEQIDDEIGPIGQGRRGWNMLKWEQPYIWTIKHINDDGVSFDEDVVEEIVEPIPAIPICHDPGSHMTWLLLGGRFYGQVLRTVVVVDEFAASDGPEAYVTKTPSWVDYLEKHELVSLRSRYARLKNGIGEGNVYMGLDTKDQLPYVPWSRELKPYIRPATYL